MKNLLKALANFQQEVPVIHKSSQGYGYTYADLPAIFEIINPILKKHGLCFSQPLQDGSIRTIIFHVESGESLESSIIIPQANSLKGMNEFQTLGSAISYLRRYSLASILGLVTDKDTDAATPQAPAPTPPKPKKTPQEVIDELQAVLTMDELKAVWSKYNKYQSLKDFSDAKETMKTKLTK